MVNLLTQIPTVMFSMDLDKIEIHSESRVRVVLKRENEVLYSENLFPYDDLVTCYSLRQVIDCDMSGRGVPYEVYTLIIDGTAHTLRMIYSDVSVHSDFADKNFLTADSVGVIPEGADTTLFYFVKAGYSTAWSCHVTYRDEWEDSFNAIAFSGANALATSTGVTSLDIHFMDIVEKAQRTAGHDDVRILSFVIKCGERRKTFYIDKFLSIYDGFKFLNVFNVPEWIYLPREDKFDYEYSQKIGTVGRSRIAYAREEDTSITSKLGPVAFSQLRAVKGFWLSKHVWTFLPDSHDEIVEISPKSLKASLDSKFEDQQFFDFEWCPLTDGFKLNPSVRSRVFTNEFDDTFI